MEFAANFKENLDFLSSFFYENPLKSQSVDHGFPKENTYNSANNLNIKFPVFDQFTIQGSSSNPFSKLIYTPFYDPFDPFQASASANIHFSNKSTFLNGGIQFLHGEGRGLVNFSNSKASEFQTMQMHDQKNVNHSQPLVSFQGIDSSVSTDSCITADKGHDQNAKKDKVQMTRKYKASTTKFNVIKGQWSREEDRLLVELVQQHGKKKWCYIAKMLPGRLGKQCRERWHNHLRPNIKKDAWSEEEDILLIEAHKKMGNRWAEMAKKLPGRSENSIKNHWNATKRRQLSSSRNKGTNPKYNTVLQNYIKTIVLTTSQDEDNIVNSNATTSNHVIVEGSSSVEFGPQQAISPTNYGYGNDNGNEMGLDTNFGTKMWAEGLGMWAEGLGFDTNDVNHVEYDRHFQQQKQLEVPLMDDEFDMGKDMSFLEMLFQK